LLETVGVHVESVVAHIETIGIHVETVGFHYTPGGVELHNRSMALRTAAANIWKAGLNLIG
jgi:hypothetical protein